MTENMNKFTKAAMAVQGKARAAGYKKSIAAVNLAAEFKARNINVIDTQHEK